MFALHTERLVIRNHRTDDLESHHLLLSDRASMYYLPDIRTHNYLESTANLMESIRQINVPDRTKYFFRIEANDTHVHIGEIGYTITSFTPLGKLVHLGYFLHKEHSGHGYATEACKELLRFAFLENDVFRVTTGCFKENAASERVMQKCGMIKEGEYKMIQWHDGTLKDRVSYRLLKPEWEALGLNNP